ncbi:MAG: hypothetical protein ACK5Y2_03765 [Bdellovibrionales bacterium]
MTQAKLKNSGTALSIRCRHGLKNLARTLEHTPSDVDAGKAIAVRVGDLHNKRIRNGTQNSRALIVTARESGVGGRTEHSISDSR